MPKPSLRVSTFEADPSFILIYSPEPVRIDVRCLRAPFTSDSVREALHSENYDLRITKDVFGRHLREIMQVRSNDESAERRQKQKQAEALEATMLRGSSSLLIRERSGLILRKQEVDAQIPKLKVEIGRAKSRAFTSGQYLSPAEFRGMESKLAGLQQESLAIQARLTEIKAEEHRANQKEWDARMASPNVRTAAFRRVAARLLPQETLDQIWAEVNLEAPKGMSEALGEDDDV